MVAAAAAAAAAAASAAAAAAASAAAAAAPSQFTCVAIGCCSQAERTQVLNFENHLVADFGFVCFVCFVFVLKFEAWNHTGMQYG